MCAPCLLTERLGWCGFITGEQPRALCGGRVPSARQSAQDPRAQVGAAGSVSFKVAPSWAEEGLCAYRPRGGTHMGGGGPGQSPESTEPPQGQGAGAEGPATCLP